MAQFLIKASYTSGGAQGLLKEGGTSRRETITLTASGCIALPAGN